jgi:hypothetical protein
MPVDQTGENILFVQDGTAVEAHIQIQYTGEPQRFAWVVPIPSLPEFKVGSDLFFRELLRASVPGYSVIPSFTQPQCAEDNAAWLAVSPLFLGAALAAIPITVGFVVVFATLGVLFTITGGCSGGAEDGLSEGGSSSSGASGATVVFRDSVGAFDITVLQAGTADEVLTWLADNQYSVPLSTRPLLAQYANENHLFAAIKLVSSAQTDEIHPIVLRYETGVPCIPLRLTAVAAAMDMGVRAFFLGNARTVPRAYRHVEINPLQLDWLNRGANYKDLVSRAVDDPESGGIGFVTEYAGPSSVLQPRNFLWWDTMGGNEARDPTEALAGLQARGLMSCGFGGGFGAAAGVTPPDSCTFFHPLVRGLLQDHLPPPAGTTERAYWSNPSAIDGATYNRNAFVEDFLERIDRPARNAAAMASRPYLTRLFTTISPDEMTVDPEFHERPDLPDVNNTNQVATTSGNCDGFTSVALPDGRVVEVPPGGTWPSFGTDMPWATRVEDIPDLTTRTSLANREAQINKSLSAWNGQRKPRPSALAECACADATEGLPVWGALVALGVVLARRRGGRA